MAFDGYSTRVPGISKTATLRGCAVAIYRTVWLVNYLLFPASFLNLIDDSSEDLFFPSFVPVQGLRVLLEMDAVYAPTPGRTVLNRESCTGSEVIGRLAFRTGGRSGSYRH